MTLAKIPVDAFTDSRVRSAQARAAMCNGIAAINKIVPKDPFCVENMD